MPFLRGTESENYSYENGMIVSYTIPGKNSFTRSWGVITKVNKKTLIVLDKAHFMGSDVKVSKGLVYHVVDMMKVLSA